MNSSCFLAVLTCISFGAASLSATDLTKIDRKITKEPAYKFKPKYCLLVFGPEARTRVWLVLDGDTLYVDRNCNGVLLSVPAVKSRLHRRICSVISSYGEGMTESCSIGNLKR